MIYLKIMPLILLLSTFVFAKSTDLTFRPARAPASNTIKVSFIGDILIHDALYLKVLNSSSKDFSQIWPQIIPLFQQADFSYGNLEGPAALGIDKTLKDRGDVGFTYDKIVYSGTDFVFNYHPRIIDDLKKSGIDIVSTSNNHTFDRGSIGIDKTIDALNEKGLTYVGTRKAQTQSPLYTITQVQNFRLAWIACTDALNGFKDKYSQVLKCYDQADEIVKTIKELKTDSSIDFVLVTPHWGIEYKETPHPLQKKHAQMFLEAGASAIIGSHPHVLQPVEKYKTQDGRETFIAYSLGNFAAYQKDIQRKASAVIYLDFSKDSAGEKWISGYSYEPTYRSGTEVFHARKNAEVVKHVEKFLGPLK